MSYFDENCCMEFLHSTTIPEERIKHDRKSLMIVPVRTGQFDPPDGATAIQRTL